MSKFKHWTVEELERERRITANNVEHYRKKYESAVENHQEITSRYWGRIYGGQKERLRWIDRHLENSRGATYVDGVRQHFERQTNRTSSR